MIQSRTDCFRLYRLSLFRTYRLRRSTHCLPVINFEWQKSHIQWVKWPSRLFYGWEEVYWGGGPLSRPPCDLMPPCMTVEGSEVPPCNIPASCPPPTIHQVANGLMALEASPLWWDLRCVTGFVCWASGGVFVPLAPSLLFFIVMLLFFVLPQLLRWSGPGLSLLIYQTQREPLFRAVNNAMSVGLEEPILCPSSEQTL